MQGPFYVDTLPPHMDTADPAIVTLTSANQPILASRYLPDLGKNFFAYPGRAVRMKLAGHLFLGATPGNFTWNIYYGNNTASNGTSLANLTITPTVNGGTVSWYTEHTIRCRNNDPTLPALITTGWLFIQGWGIVGFPPNGSSGLAVTSFVTSPLYLSMQLLRTGSTAETISPRDVSFEALN